MDPNDADANEDAARRIQEQIWMAENEDAAEANGGGGNDNDNNNNAGAVQDFVRQLLDRDNAAAGGGVGDDNNDPANDNNDEDDDLDDDDADALENRRGAVDGGIAGEVRDDQQLKITRSLKCPLVLYFDVKEEGLDEALCPGNPVLEKGSMVYIGLDKNTKLRLVFEQYCKFVNSKIPRKKGTSGGAANPDAVKTDDFEFLHCDVLDKTQTVEASAMMKNDRIRVCRERGRERSSRNEVLRMQRESDRKYFKDLRQLLPNPTPEGMGCDVVLDCRGKVVDERGFSQNVLATTVRANSVLISKRCKWLGRKIEEARESVRRRAEMTVPDVSVMEEEKGGREEEDPDEEEPDEEEEEVQKLSQSDDEDDIIMAEPPVDRGNDNNNDNNHALGNAAKVEDDEDDAPPDAKSKKVTRCLGPTRMVTESNLHPFSSSNLLFPNSVWVSLDHSPQAVKLLLEYCYTNRVQSLGQEAFDRASKRGEPKDEQSGPVPPFRKSEWPEKGTPTVSLHLALAGIALAEEARLPRLSLMCEAAAAQLVDGKNVVDVLGACRSQQQRTGNRLALLRKAAMLDCIMAGGSDGIDQLYANPSFRSNLDDRRDLVVPSLLDGTVEVMPGNMNTKDIRRKKDRRASERRKTFELHDKSDRSKRVAERARWRRESVVARRMEAAYGPFADRTPPRGGASGSDDPVDIWRECRGRDPPPPLGGGGRGAKRKGGSARSAAADGGARNVRRRRARGLKDGSNGSI